MKKGDFHAHDRKEVSQAINKEQIIGLARLFSELGFGSKVTERDNHLFDLGKNITITVVKAGTICYLEIEKMANQESAPKDRVTLENYFSNLGLVALNKATFYNLCARLTKESDWPFLNTQADIVRLKKLLAKY